MKKLMLLPLITCMVFLSAGCTKEQQTPPTPTPTPVIPTPPPPPPADPLTVANAKTFLADPAATEETVALFYNLKKLANTKIAIGQQDAFTGFYKGLGGEPDIKKATGNDPAINGLDFMFITDKSNDGTAGNWFYQQELQIAANAKKAYDKGMVNIFCWHLREPYKETSFYTSDMTATEKATAFKSILPGGAKHDWYKAKLDKVASVIGNLKGSDGKLIPVIFRPFHEFDGSWFWWGADFCTPEEYKTGFRFTVDYLLKTKGLHNVLYAFSPDNRFTTSEAYLSRYPGDAYVDVLGMDNYGDFKQGQAGSNTANAKLKIISDLATSRVKIAALTETGYSVDAANPPINGWFSNYLYNALTANGVSISFAMFWTNSNNNYYVPTPGTSNLADFTAFAAKPKVALLPALPKMYVLPK